MQQLQFKARQESLAVDQQLEAVRRRAVEEAEKAAQSKTMQETTKKLLESQTDAARATAEAAKQLAEVVQQKFTYRKFSQISAALEISATIIISQNNYWGILATLDQPEDTLHQMSATQ